MQKIGAQMTRLMAMVVMAIMSITAIAQTQVVKGVVVDEQGEPLIGATIQAKEAKAKGTTTDADGNFTLAVDAAVKNIIVSYVGMEPQTVKIQRGRKMSIRLESKTNLNEVVVTGIVNKRKESFTGASSTFTGKDLQNIGTQNVIASLKTLDPAFNVLESVEFGSDPNHMPDIEIRGKSSLISTRDELAEDPNQPLFILDGFESSLEAIYDLDMSRVASITILKDAASTAIYGSKAANGVVVVETVKPKAGHLDLSYNGSASVTWADLSSYNLMNSQEKLEFEKLAGRYTGSSTTAEVELDRIYNDRLADVQRGVDTYWLAEPLQVGVNHRHSLYAQGGEGAYRFGIGMTYNGIQGIMKESKREVIGGNIDLTYRLDKLNFSNKMSFSNTSTGDPTVAFVNYANANPYYRKYNDDGEVEKWLEYNDYFKASNPLYNAAQNSYTNGGAISFSEKLNVEYTPIKEMRVRARIGFTRTDTKNQSFVSPSDSRYSNTEYTKRGQYSNSKGVTNKYEGELTLTYGKTLKEVHMVNVAAGGYISQSDYQSDGYSTIGFPVGDYTLPSFSNGYPEGGSPSYYESTSRSVSAYLIGNYAYDNRYMLDFSYRVNGSNSFGRTKQFIGTWAVGLAWNIHREKFIKDNFEGVSMMKIRGSVGNPGNQNFSSSATITTFRYNFNMFNYFGMTTSLNQLGNPNLKWQTTLDRNIGFDVTLLNDRLTLTGDYYYKTTDPLLISIAMPPSAGATGDVMYENFGKQTTQGYYVQASYYIIRRMADRFWWSVRANVRGNKSELSGIGNRLDMFNTEGRSNNSTKRYYDGADPDDIWAVRSAGIDPATGKEVFITKEGEYTYDFNSKDEVIVGKGRPKMEGVVGTSFAYKGFSMNLDFRYRYGGKTFNSVLFNKVENISAGSLSNNQDRRALYDRWQKPGDVAQFKNIANSQYTPMSSRFVQTDNSLSLESLRIGYEFSPEVAKKMGLNTLKLSGYMNDIFRLTNIKQERGTSYPFSRSVSFALTFTL